MVIDPMLGMKKNEFLSLEYVTLLMEGEIRRGRYGDMKLKRK